MTGPSIYATAVLVGARALLIRGEAGSWKSTLALRLIQAAEAGLIPFARLVGDDRVHVAAANGRLLVWPAPALAGLLEIRGLGIHRLPYEPVAVVGWVIDLQDAGAKRLPLPEETAVIDGIELPRFAVARGADPLPAVLVFLRGAGNAAGAEPPIQVAQSVAP